ncbi:hypothetical protein AGMMS49942_28890 [Spirochaetia bacterium]|nr:hypothetical protein AGMMS49942_28890 [Spirochaetia bacterium]
MYIVIALAGKHRLGVSDIPVNPQEQLFYFSFLNGLGQEGGGVKLEEILTIGFMGGYKNQYRLFIGFSDFLRQGNT